MKKIITAINNPDLNNKLNNEKNIQVVCKDIQYKDAIIDVLKNDKNIDIIIINEKIPGEIDDNNLIKEIKNINENIKIIYIVEKLNKKIENILKENNIEEYYLNNEITNNNILKIINGEFNKKEIYDEINFKIITISGPPNVGKTNFIINLFKMINNKKILIIDFDIKKQNIHYFLGLKKYSKIINKLSNNDFENILANKINNNYSEIKKFLIKYFLIKLNKNKYLISGLDLLSNFFEKENYEYFLKDILNQLKNRYDLILFDIGSENNPKVNKIIYNNSDLNIILVEGNLIGITKYNYFIKNNNYINNYKIIINKKDKYSIDKKILNNIFHNKILGTIKYEKIYNNLINKNYNFNFINLKKYYYKDYKKIYNKLFKKNNL